MPDLSFNFKQNLMHLFLAACKRIFNFLFMFGYINKSKKGWINAMHNNLGRGKHQHVAIVHRQQLMAYHLYIKEKRVVPKWIPEELRIGGFQILRKYFLFDR